MNLFSMRRNIPPNYHAVTSVTHIYVDLHCGNQRMCARKGILYFELLVFKDLRKEMALGLLRSGYRSNFRPVTVALLALLLL